MLPSNTEVANEINTGFCLNLMCFINEQLVAFSLSVSEKKC